MSTTFLLVILIAAVAAATAFGAAWARAFRRAARLEEETRHLRDQLERARDARETFFDLVTHELRSPLSAILGYQELLEDGSYGTLPGPAADSIDRLGRSARHLLHLIDGVVELSRMRSGTVHPDIRAVDLALLFDAVADAFRAKARERRIEPRVEIHGALPIIHSDQDRLARALDLVVSSAVKYPHDYQVTLDITSHGHSVTARFTGIELPAHQDVEEVSLRVGIRLAVAEGTARLLGGALDFETDDEGTIRALSFTVPDLGPDSTPDL